MSTALDPMPADHAGADEHETARQLCELAAALHMLDAWVDELEAAEADGSIDALLRGVPGAELLGGLLGNVKRRMDAIGETLAALGATPAAPALRAG